MSREESNRNINWAVMHSWGVPRGRQTLFFPSHEPRVHALPPRLARVSSGLQSSCCGNGFLQVCTGKRKCLQKQIKRRISVFALLLLQAPLQDCLKYNMTCGKNPIFFGSTCSESKVRRISFVFLLRNLLLYSPINF